MYAQWDPVNNQCVVTKTSHDLFAAAILYSSCMDFLALVLCAAKLLPKRSYSQLPELMFKDGLAYFVVA